MSIHPDPSPTDLDNPRTPLPRFEPGPLGKLVRLAFRYRGRAVLLWLAAFVVALGLSTAFAGAFNADYSAPGSDSHAAQDLLSTRFPAAGNDTVTLVAHSTEPVTDPVVRARIDQVLDQAGAVPHVAGFADPYQNPGAISPDETTTVTILRVDTADPLDMPHESAAALIRIAKDSSRDGLTVAVSGVSIVNEEAPPIGSEVVGLLAAAVILLLMFGSIVAAGLPILVALAGLAVSSMLTGLIAAMLPVPDWSTSLATMIGIGVGIDYALLMVTRFREWRAEGLDPEEATVATLDTAGRSVVLAGGTVVISMLGLFGMGLSFMRGAALVTIAAIAAIAIVLLSAITLFPALLGYFGAHIDRLRLPFPRRRARKHGSPIEAGSGWVRWSHLVRRHRFVAAATGLGILLAVAAPFLGVHFGFPDSGNSAEDSSTRNAYDLLADGFGPGVNGPLLITTTTTLPDGSGDSSTGATALADRLTTAMTSTPGVAAVSPVQRGPAGDTAIMIVTPTTGPQDPRTEDLVRTLRADVIPTAIAGSDAAVHVGGAAAVSIDSTANISQRIPVLIAAVVLMLLLLLVAFRSIAVAVKAAVMNLLSVAAAYGVVALVLQGGWAGQLIGIDHPTPLAPFIPVLMFAVLFGLSMDYEVFLVARIRETWLATGSNTQAIVKGLAGTARVITAAAAIMIAVFAAFIPSTDIALKVIGIGMAAAILIDATVIRMLLVPAVMHLLGDRNWWLPAWLDRALPDDHIEGHPQHYQPTTSGNAEQPTTAPQLASV